MKLADAIQHFKAIEGLRRPEGDHTPEFNVTLKAAALSNGERYFSLEVSVGGMPSTPPDWSKIVALAAEFELTLMPYEGYMVLSSPLPA
jgi:hypothetical protein